MLVRKSKIVFAKVFNGGPLEKGDYVMFPHGKAVWKVGYISKGKYNSIRLEAITDWGSTYWLGSREKDRVFKISKEEAIYQTARNHPTRLTRVWHEHELRTFFRNHLKE